MSGGFFRGTSADQDTRFSNKMAKLRKTQKFPPELDQLIDMSKVKIDVIRPWIAKRVTELLGFEDEVLINFIFGLLEGKDVDGKHIQIQLTGFMEKNTGKFMKELWSLLTSAQSNISGVPQQFLDAKAEEARKKRAEDQRIASELSRRKEEERDLLAEHEAKPITNLGAMVAAQSPKDRSPGISAKDSPRRQLEQELNESGMKSGASRRSHSRDQSPILCSRGDSRRTNARFARSKSRSQSSSASLSRSPRRRHRLSRSRSKTPQRFLKPKSPTRRIRSPLVPRSPPRSPPRRGRSPFVPYSPPRRRRPPVFSQSPPRKRKSPLAWSPPKHRRRSPIYAHSPRRAAISRSPQRRRVPSPRRRHSPTFSASPSPPCALRSGSRSPQWIRRSSSRERVGRYNGFNSRKNDHRTSQRIQQECKMDKYETRNISKQQTSEKTRDRRDQGSNETRTMAEGRLAPSSSSRQQPSLSASPSPDHDIKKPTNEETSHGRIAYENRENPLQECVPHVLANSKSKLEPSPEEPLDHTIDNNLKKDVHGSYLSRKQEQGQKVYSKESNVFNLSEDHLFRGKESKEVHLGTSKRISSEVSPLLEDKRHQVLKRSHDTIATKVIIGGSRRPVGQVMETTYPAVDGDNDVHGRVELQKTRKVERDSSSEDDVEKSDSPTRSDERRKARKRKKEEKRLRKELKRRKREEKHRRREEKRASKAFKEVASVTPPPDMNQDVSMFARPDYDKSGTENISQDDEMESEQKRLENELRKKALDSLKAKKAVN